ncbi:MAG: ATP-binding domain-containing protein [Myxococcales bacterium]|nr:ATP-binding domain-containing protein [Myxococcales bacterium]
MAVVARTKGRVKDYADSLNAGGITHAILDADTENIGPGIRLATMHRVKGLDFTHVLMEMPPTATMQGAPREQSLLYVAATRCRKTLTVLQTKA